MAREAIRVFREEDKLKAFNEYHSKYACFVKTDKFVVPVAEKKEAAPAKATGKAQK
jgi:hypothetical protein